MDLQGSRGSYTILPSSYSPICSNQTLLIENNPPAMVGELKERKYLKMFVRMVSIFD